jgi:hypothetical protein
MLITLMGLNDDKQNEILKHSLTVSQARSNGFTMAFKKTTENY